MSTESSFLATKLTFHFRKQKMKMIEVLRYNLTLVFEPDPDGGYVVNCEELPELITEGDTLDEAFANAKDAFETILDAYKRIGRKLPEPITRRQELLSQSKQN